MTRKISTLDALNPLTESVKAATGRDVHKSTLNRWATKGFKGVRLETVRLGGRQYCSIRAVQRFMAELTNRTEDPGSANTAKPTFREGKAKAAKMELRALLYPVKTKKRSAS